MRSGLRPSIALLMTGALLIVGCPPDLQPPTPDGGRACVGDEDCNPPGTTCGERFLCVQELCESTPSVVVPCPGTGMRP